RWVPAGKLVRPTVLIWAAAQHDVALRERLRELLVPLASQHPAAIDRRTGGHRFGYAGHRPQSATTGGQYVMVDQRQIQARVTGSTRLVSEMIVGTTRPENIGREQQHHARMIPPCLPQIHTITKPRTARHRKCTSR